MKTIFLSGLFILATSLSATADLVVFENAVEVLELDVAISKDKKGYVAGRECKRCSLKRFAVTPEVVFFLGWQSITFSAGKSKTFSVSYSFLRSRK